MIQEKLTRSRPGFFILLTRYGVCDFFANDLRFLVDNSFGDLYPKLCLRFLDFLFLFGIGFAGFVQF